jgi:beta-lactamase class D
MHAGSVGLPAWFVGHLLTAGRQYTFATNIFSGRDELGSTARKNTIDLLRAARLLQ